MPSNRLFAAAALWLAVSAAHAAPPVVLDLTPSFSFEAYAGEAPVGVGAVDVDKTLFYIDEKSVDGLKSWLLFYDADRFVSFASATLRFDQPIVAVYSTRADLDATTPTFGADGITYGSSRLMGLEGRDTVIWTPGESTLSLRLVSIDPGDHIRVVTVVPEPGTTGLLLAGLGVVAWLARRRPT